MKIHATLLALTLALAAGCAAATETTKPTTSTSTGSTTTPPPSTTTAPKDDLIRTGPQLAVLFRIVKPDGFTVIRQGNMGKTSATSDVITIMDKEAFLMSNGHCAFNVRYDEGSLVAAKGTTNRIFDNGTLIAQNTKIDVVPGVLKSIWTQPYLVPGFNNIRLVVNVDGITPSEKWIRVYVGGTCTAPPKPATTTTTGRI